mgnify:CR=1 FL=1
MPEAEGEGPGVLPVVVPPEASDTAWLESLIDDDEQFAVASGRQIEADPISERDAASLVKAAVEQFEKYVGLSKKVPAEVLTSLSGIDEPGRLADTISAHMGVDLEEKQRILEIADVQGRLEHLQSLMDAEIDLFQVEKRIRGRVKKQMEKSQREYYLNEQMKAIQKQLGDDEEEAGELRERIEAANPSSGFREGEIERERGEKG